MGAACNFPSLGVAAMYGAFLALPSPLSIPFLGVSQVPLFLSSIWSLLVPFLAPAIPEKYPAPSLSRLESGIKINSSCGLTSRHGLALPPRLLTLCHAHPGSSHYPSYELETSERQTSAVWREPPLSIQQRNTRQDEEEQARDKCSLEVSKPRMPHVGSRETAVQEGPLTLQA